MRRQFSSSLLAHRDSDSTGSKKVTMITPRQDEQQIVTIPMTARFSPAADCIRHWTYEGSDYNQITGGLLIQRAGTSVQDQSCYPGGLGTGRAPDTFELFSPGACPVSYTTAKSGIRADVTTAVCCPRYLLKTSCVLRTWIAADDAQGNFAFIVPLSGSDGKTFYGCTSTYPSSAGPTTVPERHGVSATVTGPIAMWAQPLTVGFQQKDLSLFFPSTHTTATSTSSAPSKSPVTDIPRSHTAVLSGGAIAGIVIGVAGVLCVLLAAIILFMKKKRKSRGPPMQDGYNSQQEYWPVQQEKPKAETAELNALPGRYELGTVDRRYELQ